MTKRAVLYARVSGDDRSNSTSSLEGQIELCRDYAIKQGWQVIEELAEDDRGASGADWNLPQLNKALDWAKAGKFDVLVTRELDRLARSLAKQLVFETEFNRFGVKIVYAIGDYQDNLEGQLSKQIRAVIAEYERLKISERMVRGRRRKAKSGYVVLHGNVPYGYKRIDDEHGTKLEIEEKTAEIVRMIFELYTVKGWGSPKICKELNRLGIPTPSASDKNRGKRPKANNWNQSQVMRIIKNETYMGNWRYGKRSRKNKNPRDYHIVVEVPAIVSEEIFLLAQEKCRTNTIMSSRNTKYEYLLARRCYCANCHASMASLTKTERDNTYSYYRCQVPSAQDTHYLHFSCNVRTHFSVNYWDKQIWAEIRAFLSNPTKLIKGIQEYQKKQEKVNAPKFNRLNIIDELIEEKNVELERALDLYISGEFSRDMIHERKHRLEQTIKDLQEEKELLRAEIGQTLAPEQLLELEIFSKEITDGLSEADEDFETRRRMIDYLGVKAFFAVEDGVQVVYLHCEFGFNKRLLFNRDLASGNLSRPLQSEPATNSHGEEEDNYSSIGKHSRGYKHN